MPELAERLGNFPDSVIGEMNLLAAHYGAVNLSSGYPDFDPPEELLEAAHRALRAGFNQYADTRGSPRFRQALAEKQSHFMGIEIDPEAHVTVTCGGTEAMLDAILAVCNRGDQVIVFSPYYEIYAPDLYLSGDQPLYVPLRPPKFELDYDELRRAFRQGAKALVLCNPSNPSGKVFSQTELEIIAGLAQEFDAYVITDDVYEHITYAPHRCIYLSSLPGMFERTIACGSLSKTYSITGWRLGYTIAPKWITDGIRRLHDYVTLGAPAPLQEAAVTALKFPNSYYQNLQSEYTRRRAIFLEQLDRAGLGYIMPQGAYYVLVNIAPFEFPDDTAFCYWLIKEVGVAGVPASSFFHEPVRHLVRLNFAKSDKTLYEAGKRLLKLRELG